MTSRAGGRDPIGRAAELAAVREFLDDPTGGALVVRGGPGAGKTTLVEAALRHVGGAADIVRINGRAAGTSSPYSAMLAGLDAVRQHPRWGTWVDAMSQTIERHAKVAADAPREEVAVLADELAAVTEGMDPLDRATVLVVDDLDAADPHSRQFMALAADRAASSRLSYLVTTAAEVPIAADHPEIELRGLDATAVRRLLEASAGHRIPMPVADGIRLATGGLPLAVHEIVGRLAPDRLRGLEPLPVPLPVTERLVAACRPALDGLDPTAIAALAMFGCRSTIDLGSFAAAVGGIGAVEDLIRDDLVRWHGGIVEPSPRIQPAVAWSLSTLSALSTVAGLLAAESQDDDERLVYQLVDHASKPAEWLDRLVVRLRSVANERAAYPMAALGEYRLGGSTDLAFLPALAIAYEGMGATTAAERVLDRLQRQDPHGSELLSHHMCRARISGLKGFSRTDDDSWDVLDAVPPAESAPQADTRIALDALRTFQAHVAPEEVGSDAGAEEDAASADGRRRAELMELAERLRSGAPVDFDAYRAAITTQVDDGLWTSWIYLVAFARDLLAIGDPQTARRLLKQRLGSSTSAVEHCACLAALAEVEVWNGRYARALELAREVDSRVPSTAVEGLNLRGILLWCHAATGDGADLLARYDGEPPAGVGPVQIYTRAAAAGYAHLAAGQPIDAAGLLNVVVRNGRAVPHLLAECLADLVEAHVASGDVAGARRELDRGRELLIETTSARTGHLLRRCAALTVDPSTADGLSVLDDDGPADPDGVGDAARARTAIAHARVLIGAGRVDEARARLGRAEQILRVWGLVGWLPEIDRLRAVEAAGAGPWSDLTADERRIVAMVVDGARNREIAAEMYVSLRTAEAALTRIFRTVGVANRRQLIALASRSGIGGPAEQP